MQQDLPVFRKVPRRYAARFINEALSSPRGASLLDLIEFEDHHFRVIFRVDYFQLSVDASAPSKSQWSTLRKKLKRRNRSVFVFRESGQLECPQSVAVDGQQICLYLDFGFMND